MYKPDTQPVFEAPNHAFFQIPDPPKILRVTGGGTVGVHNKTIMTCSAEGNPLPKYQWLQKMPSQQVTRTQTKASSINDVIQLAPHYTS